MRNTASGWLPTGCRAVAYQTLVWFGTLLVFEPVEASEPHPFTAFSAGGAQVGA